MLWIFTKPPFSLLTYPQFVFERFRVKYNKPLDRSVLILYYLNNNYLNNN